ncbi:carbohydrate kinase FGGY [Catenulispora acidiphila DSM 44928]|uniref:Carbohydrate kinase FGGY n=1 Tax=Catenulispora acidiphila (strain DSM 44928 / JCM 14897 / NBRC 102108 / NRRL B-24433 / ID139908) TaxID=479433 RepID=C7Q063_CATAD|nr:rhamnulokinase family protein [Catenulispora acidiphila]ACU75556.1 carbohydrate kinase FGGY [Catenulispora acidiphila DSM 44928]
MSGGTETGTTGTVAAVDLGASSGRVMVARVGTDCLKMREAHRFENRPVRVGGTLYWDALALYQGIVDGLRAGGQVASIGIDSWAVDYGLLDADGALVGNPVHYRDARTEGVAERAWKTVPAEALYAVTGIQHAPFNTLYQLIAARGTGALAAARQALLIPDLMAYWLTGIAGTEVTNASTTQLLDASSRTWSADLAGRLGVDVGLFPPLRQPGARIGDLLPAVLEAAGLRGPVPVTAVASHDTASAVVAVPAAAGERFAYISTGTWSLAGLELEHPVLSEASRAANFTNEAGIDGTIRYLRNIMGLWLLQECVREWRVELPALLAAARKVPGLRSVIDAADATFLAPDHMPDRIREACRATGQPVPNTPPEITRCILDSLALAHRRAIEDAQRLADQPIDVVHMVGGAVRNTLLCQLTADACGLPVVAGPTEAAALGNVLVQARALGLLGDRTEMRALVARTQSLTRYVPGGDRAAWDEAAARLSGGF